MNLYQLLPTKKVTAFILGAALTIVGLWILGPENLALIEIPDAKIQSAIVVIVGFVLAWVVPESAWAKAGKHTEGAVQLPPEPGDED